MRLRRLHRFRQVQLSRAFAELVWRWSDNTGKAAIAVSTVVAVMFAAAFEP